MASALATSLIAARDSLAAVVAAQTAAWQSAGCPPDFSVDGESYQWTAWLSGKLDQIEKLNAMIARSQPFYRRSRYRG